MRLLPSGVRGTTRPGAAVPVVRRNHDADLGARGMRLAGRLDRVERALAERGNAGGELGRALAELLAVAREEAPRLSDADALHRWARENDMDPAGLVALVEDFVG